MRINAVDLINLQMFVPKKQIFFYDFVSNNRASHARNERADLAATLLTEDQVKVPPVILHLLGNLVASERRLVTALAATTTVTAIVGDADSPEKCVAADPVIFSCFHVLMSKHD